MGTPDREPWVMGKVHDPNDGPATEPENTEEDTGVEEEDIEGTGEDDEDDDDLGLDDDDEDSGPEYEEGLLGEDDED